MVRFSHVNVWNSPRFYPEANVVERRPDDVHTVKMRHRGRDGWALPVHDRCRASQQPLRAACPDAGVEFMRAVNQLVDVRRW
jgi:hypothetical protein